jgi:putative Mn2+ efflux pump MntP
LDFIIVRKAGALIGRWAETAGGLILIANGVRIVRGHTL